MVLESTEKQVTDRKKVIKMESLQFKGQKKSCGDTEVASYSDSLHCCDLSK